MFARYADGRAAVLRDADVEIGADTMTIRVGEATHVWAYAELKRTDDGNGRIALKRKPDTGERIVFDNDAEAALKAVAPTLFTPSAHGVESHLVVGGVVAAAWALAAGFLIGIPLLARPMANVMPPIYREQIADISWSQVNALTQYCDDSDQAADILNAMAYRMMEASNVPERDAIWITVVDASFPNAFALPDDSIIITDDLLQMAESPDEVAGVLAHEIAHIEHDHVMTGVVRQMGAGIFFDIVFGGAGAGQAFAIASVNLTGLRYTRGDEEDADARGLDYLDAAGIDSGGIAHLFGRLEEMQSEAGIGDIPELLSSHPGHAARAAAAEARSRAGLDPALSAAQWRIVQQACGGQIEQQTPTPAQAPPQPAGPETPQPAPPKPQAPVDATPHSE